MLHEQAAVEALSELSGFRDGFYDCLDARADALFELADAAICTDGPVTSLAQLSLAPVFRRGHGALYDALADGAVDEERLRDLLAGQLPAGAPLMFGVDATTYPRPNAECSPHRGLHYAPCRCDGDRKVVPGWKFQWVTGLAVPGSTIAENSGAEVQLRDGSWIWCQVIGQRKDRQGRWCVGIRWYASPAAGKAGMCWMAPGSGGSA